MSLYGLADILQIIRVKRIKTGLKHNHEFLGFLTLMLHSGVKMLTNLRYLVPHFTLDVTPSTLMWRTQK